MSRRSYLITTAALLAVCATPASAATYEDLTDPAPSPSSIARSAGDEYQDLRSPDARDAARDVASAPTPGQDLRSPDARDAARDVASAPTPGQDLRSPDATDAAAHRGIYAPDGGSYVLDRDYGSPDVVDAARDLPPVQIPTPVVEVRGAPSGGFDWGDAGIGAAGVLALFSIAGGSALMLTGRKRRREVQVVTH